MKKQSAFSLLRLFCPPHLLEEIEGDLVQRYEKDVAIHGVRKAKMKLAWNIIRYLRLEIVLRNQLKTSIKPFDMHSNYFKVMCRHLTKHKLQSSINLLGLTVGITLALFAIVYITEELSVNSELKDAERLYLLESKSKSIVKYAEFFVPSLLAPEAKEKYPQIIEEFYRFFDREITVSKDDKHFRVQSMIGDSTFLKTFGLKVLFGTPQSSLTQVNSVVITEKTARQFFNRANVVGEPLTIHTERNGLKDFIVTAVIATPKAKNTVSDLANMNAQIFLPLENIGDFAVPKLDGWLSYIITFVKLTPTADSTQAIQMFNQLLQSDAPESVKEDLSIGMNSLNDYYLIANHAAVQKMLLSLSAIVVLILLLAITNFVNLSIANAFSRLKEIGLRKAIGGFRAQISLQFIFESVLLTIFAGLLATMLYEVFRNYAGGMLNMNMPSLVSLSSPLWGIFVAGIILIGILAGIYPAVYLSSSKVSESLKGKLSSSSSSINFTKGLISIQYIITFFVIVLAAIITLQVDFFMKKDLGYERSHVITVSSTPRLWNDEGFARMETAKVEFIKTPGVESVSLSWGSPNWNFSPYDTSLSLRSNPNERISVVVGSADEHYSEVFGLKVTDGKFFTEAGGDYRAGKNEIVLNETARNALGYQVGDVLTFQGGEFTVVGIVKDFHFETLQENVKPVVIMNNKDFRAYRHFSFKLMPDSPSRSVKIVEEAWKKIFPAEPFVFSFAEDHLKAAYKSELQLQKAATLATLLTSFIVITGILGLVSLSLARRTKEIGIRRVMGASLTDIQVLIAKEYLVIIIFSLTISLPLTYWYGTLWLSGFAYRIQLAPWMFIIPTLALIVLTLAIVTIKSYQSAISDPVKSLRSE